MDFKFHFNDNLNVSMEGYTPLHFRTFLLFKSWKQWENNVKGEKQYSNVEKGLQIFVILFVRCRCYSRVQIYCFENN